MADTQFSGPNQAAAGSGARQNAGQMHGERQRTNTVAGRPGLASGEYGAGAKSFFAADVGDKELFEVQDRAARHTVSSNQEGAPASPGFQAKGQDQDGKESPAPDGPSPGFGDKEKAEEEPAVAAQATEKEQTKLPGDSPKSGALDNVSAKSGDQQKAAEAPAAQPEAKDEQSNSQRAPHPQSSGRVETNRSSHVPDTDNDAAHAPAPLSTVYQDEYRETNFAALEDFNLLNQNDLEQWGLDDVEIGNLDEILECGDDLLEIEQTAFMGSSKIMLKMIDNMLSTIDQRIDNVNHQGWYESDVAPPMVVQN